MKETLVELCYSHPHLYRLCDKAKCIPYQQKCPCKIDTEFQCSLGNCIPLKSRCDGVQQCMYGEDEQLCHLYNTTEVTDIENVMVTESYRPEQSTSKGGLSVPVMVTVVSFSVFILILLCILFCFYLTSRRTKHSSHELQSATEPLQETYLTANVDDSDSSDQSRETYKLRTYPSTRSNRLNYLPVNINDSHSDYQVNIHKANDHDDISAMDYNLSADNDNAHFKGRNMAINPDVEIYNTGIHNKSRADGLGKYSFKPTFNYMRSKSYHEINEDDSDKLFVRNSYKKCPAKDIVPQNMSTNKDEEKLSFNFVSGLLCSSTPRQSHRQSVSYNDVSDI